MTFRRRAGIAFCGLLLLTVLIFAGLVWLGRMLPPASSGTSLVPQAASGAFSPGQLVIPVAGIQRSAITDSWGDPRENGLRQHHGTDIAAPQGTPVLAAAPGTIEKLWTSRAGGTTLYERSADGAWVYYYAHLSAYAPGLHEGQVVRAGDTIAFVGDTGDAGAGNFHLHFGLQRMQPGERWYQGQDVNPYPILAGRAALR